MALATGKLHVRGEPGGRQSTALAAGGTDATDRIVWHPWQKWGGYACPPAYAFCNCSFRLTSLSSSSHFSSSLKDLFFSPSLSFFSMSLTIFLRSLALRAFCFCTSILFPAPSKTSSASPLSSIFASRYSPPSARRWPASMIHFSVATRSQNSRLWEITTTPH